MASVSVLLDKKTINLIRICKGFDIVKIRLLIGLGKKSAYILRQWFLSDQYLKFRHYKLSGNTGIFAEKAKKGKPKRMISLRLVRSNNDLVIKSFPLNLFEKSRAGYKDKPIYQRLLTTKLKDEVAGKVGNWAEGYSDKIINGELNK